MNRAETEPTDSLEEIAGSIFAMVKANFDRGGVPARSPHCGRPYLNRIQRAALFVLKERMGWSCRGAERALRDNPAALRVMGVAQPPDHRFFCRAGTAVAQLQIFFAPSSAA